MLTTPGQGTPRGDVVAHLHRTMAVAPAGATPALDNGGEHDLILSLLLTRNMMSRAEGAREPWSQPF